MVGNDEGQIVNAILDEEVLAHLTNRLVGEKLAQLGIVEGLGGGIEAQCKDANVHG